MTDDSAKKILVDLIREHKYTWEELKAIDSDMIAKRQVPSTAVKSDKRPEKALCDRPEYEQLFNKVLKQFIADGHIDLERLKDSVYGKKKARLGLNGNHLYNSRKSCRSNLSKYLNRDFMPKHENLVVIVKCLLSESFEYSLSRDSKKVPSKDLIDMCYKIFEAKPLKIYLK